jgi:type IV secretion system protein VirB8
MQFFKKKEVDDSIVSNKNWYADRYQSVLVQRNFLLLLTMVSLAGIIVSVLAVIKVTSSKTIEPFVIEIEERSGVTNVIRPLLKEKFAYDEVLRRYFLMKYMNARETYDPASYEYAYSTVVRLLSSGEVYGNFRQTISSDNLRSPIRLGFKGKRLIKVVSITPLTTAAGQKGFTAQVRFTSTDVSQQGNSVDKHLVATINFDYQDLNLTKDERDINPLGFQVTEYRVDEETL